MNHDLNRLHLFICAHQISCICSRWLVGKLFSVCPRASCTRADSLNCKQMKFGENKKLGSDPVSLCQEQQGPRAVQEAAGELAVAAAAVEGGVGERPHALSQPPAAGEVHCHYEHCLNIP